jgi:hypothetical protein
MDSDGIVVEEDPYIMFWSGFKNYRTVGGPTPYPEDQKLLDPQTSIFGGMIDDVDSYNNGGMWLNSVFRKSDIFNTSNTNRLIGFYHAEDHYYSPGTSNDGNKAWKSMGMAISRDNGFTWRNKGQFITSSKTKPTTPTWGGAADGSIIWHEPDQRWICYYSSHKMAISEHPEGLPGTWFKYYEGNFSTQPGLGGETTEIEGLKSVAGANPSVHYNTYLEMWIMVFHSWSGCHYISSSMDAYEWSTPQEILCSEHEDGRTWYPTIIGESNVLAGETARLYYADMYDGSRDFIGQEIVFTITDDEDEEEEEEDDEQRVLVSGERLSLPQSQSSVVESLETSAMTSDLSVATKLVTVTVPTVRSNALPTDATMASGSASTKFQFLTTTTMLSSSSILLLGVSVFASICA